MNCFNQQFSGMTDFCGQNSQPGFQGRTDDRNVPAWKNRTAQRNTPEWQGTPWGGSMPGWNGQTDTGSPLFWQPSQPGFDMPSQDNSGLDCGMPPQTIPPVQVLPSPAAPAAPARPEQPAQPQRTENQVNNNFACKMETGQFPIAMGYVPIQKWCQPRPITEGLARGTIFKELDLPFMMGRCQ